MLPFIFGAILIGAALIVLAATRKKRPEFRLLTRVGCYAATGLGLVAVVISMFYTQNVGQTVVQKSITGQITGQTLESGIHLKAPWIKPLRYDVRNNTISYVGAGENDHSGRSATGPQITFQDADNVTADLDLAVRYSIVPNAAESIYARYGTQEAFVAQVITNDVRSIARDVPAGFTTSELLNDRAAAGAAIFEGLEARWEDDGIIVEAVNLQEIRYPQDVKDRFSQAQNSRIEIDRAQADMERAEVEAQTKVIQAKGLRPCAG